MIDFDWVIDTRTFGKQTVFSVGGFPAFWSEGEGDMANPKCDKSSGVRLVERFR
jgi:hypothetical protein